MRISDWSSDVCSSDLHEERRGLRVCAREVDHLLALRGDRHAGHDGVVLAGLQRRNDALPGLLDDLALDLHAPAEIGGEIDLEAEQLAGAVGGVDRKRVVWGRSVSVRGDLGGRRVIKKKNK